MKDKEPVFWLFLGFVVTALCWHGIVLHLRYNEIKELQSEVKQLKREMERKVNK